MYVVFDGVEEYVRFLAKGRYSTCHEVFLSNTYIVDDDIQGHPAFDIDRDFDKLIGTDTYVPVNWPTDWKESLQADIVTILCMQYPIVAKGIEDVFIHESPMVSPWVWMTSNNIKKISKHLVVRSIAFSMWRVQMTLLVDELVALSKESTLLKSHPDVINSIDGAIMRKLGSLRLPLNSKRPTLEGNAPKLLFDDSAHNFLDGIVMIHDANIHTLRGGMMLTLSNLAPSYRDKILTPIPSVLTRKDHVDDVVREDTLVEKFLWLDSRYHTGLAPGQVNDGYLSLVRESPGKCPVSGRIHDSDNAYMFQRDGKIFYGCHRRCTVNMGGNERKILELPNETDKQPLSEYVALEIATKIKKDMTGDDE